MKIITKFATNDQIRHKNIKMFYCINKITNGARGTVKKKMMVKMHVNCNTLFLVVKIIEDHDI